MSEPAVKPPKPVPLRTRDNAPFLDGLREGRVLLQRCTACERLRYPAARHCPSCLSEQQQWVAVSGRGHVYSFIIVHQVYQAAFGDEVPYNVVVVQLDEGPRITSNVVGCTNDAIRIGLSVEPEFVRLGDHTVLKFRLVTAT
jgi:uncharacterized protein